MKRLLPLAVVVLAAGCGGAKAPSVAGGAATAASTTTAAGGAGTDLAYARCMRAHGVPGFPDPQAGGGFQFRAGGGVNPSSPAFASAQAKCSKLMGGIAPGTSTHPSSRWLSHMVKVSQCMRTHGVPSFPDPTTTIPQMPAGGGLISDIEGAVFVFPSATDEQSPAFVRAATTCGFPLHDH